MPSPDAMANCRATRSGNTISVAGTLDFQTAKTALTDVSALMAGAGELTIDLAGVTRSNSAGLALLVEWLSVAERNKQTLSFENIPDTLRQISSVCQVDSLI